MAGAGFAAGFFGEATNIMRERGKQKREDELIAEERKQKDADWARQTEHELNMVTARYDLETRAAREEKAKKAEALATTLISAGFKPEEIAPYLKDPDTGMLHLESMLGTVTSNKLNPKQVRSLLDTIGMDGISDEAATAVKSGEASGVTPSSAALSFQFASTANPRAQTSPEEARFVAEQASSALRTSALQERDKWNAIALDDTADEAARTKATEEINKIDTAINEADKNGNISLLMDNYGVKAVYDMLDNPGLAGYDVLNNPELQRNPAIVQKAQDIAGTTEFLGEQVESPYEALAMIQRDIDVWRTKPTYQALLESFVTIYDKSFLPPELAKDYNNFVTQ